MKKTTLFTGLRDFLILWSSQTVSGLGTAMTNFALTIWVYGEQGTASSMTLLTICSFLPTIFFRFIAGAIADRWDKKKVMLLSDSIAAFATAVVFVLYSLSALRVWHIYVINILLSFMNAFQSPASFVATSLLVPREQYTRVNGLQSFAGSVITILAPALGSVLLMSGGLTVVLIVDLASFSVAFVALMVFIKLPELPGDPKDGREPLFKSCVSGINFLREHSALMRLILFFSGINFLAKLGGDGMMSVFILGKTGGSQQALGMVETAVALGLLVGSVLVTLMKPAKHKVEIIFISCGVTFLVGNVLLSLTDSLPLWSAAAFVSYVPVAILGANLTSIMRTHVPVAMQGRVFSARDTIQNCTIPLGLFLGGVLADNVFEPFMAAPSPIQQKLAFLFGAERGSGIAVLFFIVGVIGFLISIAALKRPIYKQLNREP